MQEGAPGFKGCDGMAPTPPRYRRIPAGNHGLASEEVLADQVARVHAAMVQFVAEHGYGAVAVAVEQVIAFANVSRRLFYAEFADKESCFLATLEVVLSQWREQLPMGFASHGGELRGEPQRVVRVALDVLFEQISVDPLGARLLFVEAAAPGPAAQAWVAEVAAELRTLTMTLLGGTDGDPVVSPSVAGGIIGGVIENDRCPHRGRLGR